MPIALSGIAVSKGIAIGKARVLQHGQLDIAEYVLPPHHIDSEVARFNQALETARVQLRTIRNQIPKQTPQEIAAFIDTHLLMLQDEALSRAPVALIRHHRCNAEWALKLQQDALVQAFDAMEDPYLRTRRDDVEHVVRRVQQILLREEQQSGALESDRDEPRIILAVDIAPSDLVLLSSRHLAAIVTERGGPLSHTAILARSLGIPALVGVPHVHQYVRNDEVVILDANNGSLLLEPDAATLKHYRARQRAAQRTRRELYKLKDDASLSRDGIPVTLHANIELSEDITALKRVGAAGVGLYRTEFLFMNREFPPDENEQYQTYRHTLRRLNGLPLTIRTLDLGADKEIVAGATACTNPALGLRAVRLCLKEPQLFLPQLRAILRASAKGPVRLLIPMLTSVQELAQVMALLEQARAGLRREKKPFDPALPIGAMIEVPAAAICADLFAQRLDFLSIGTNDLMQYTLATDRIDESVNHLFDPLNPGVLRLIQGVIKAGAKANIPVSMCGEMAGDTRYTRLLLAMGLREFSMPAASLLEVKQLIRQCDITKLQRPLAKLMASPNPTACGIELGLIGAG
ncbi:MAG: phosphoenolpyruvate--protein phosphotransferase [Gammaproteobacteria bacterium]|nr:phosphoenolpyruvate--protein phosphotransferase [Gammaproteobacteria bacterium]